MKSLLLFVPKMKFLNVVVVILTKCQKCEIVDVLCQGPSVGCPTVFAYSWIVELQGHRELVGRLSEGIWL